MGLGLVYNDSISVMNFKQKLLTRFKKIVALEGCRGECATKLLGYIDIIPYKTIHLSDKCREEEKFGVTLEEDLALEERVKHIATKVLDSCL